MIAPGQERLLTARTKELLDRSAENLDIRTKQRLEYIRMMALETVGQKRGRFFLPNRWLTVGGVATVVTAVVALVFWYHAPSAVPPAKNIDDFEIISSREQIDFYRDLEFYRWLATQNEMAEKAITL